MFEFVRFSVIGLLIGLSSSYTFIAMTNAHSTIPGGELRKEFMIAAVLGIVIGWISLIFKTERFGLTIQLVFHFVAVTICAFIAGYLGNWYDASNILTLLCLLLYIMLIYAISWGVTLVILKKNIQQMNQSIQKRRKHV